ncbi:MAG: L-seryl-tRNA(Sec) selenium transferase [Desulfobacterales bacterium]|jgi:L-seryl-tRNA(Ser) seleniumtransferase|nr:L-seryl-tRNA(Sec) selenium transferase [Desulfobacterales bacterium]
MAPNDSQRNLLRMLPGVDRILAALGRITAVADVPKAVLVRCARLTLDVWRERILAGGAQAPAQSPALEAIVEEVLGRVAQAMAHNLKRVVNASGIVVHTNLGRSPLAAAVLDNLVEIASRYSNLEFDLAAGRRGSRYTAVEDVICEISGAEAAMVVNNNAGAVLLCLETLARGRKVIVSRGELVEIGGAFRIPDVMAKSGGILSEVGTTNRTHLRDYAGAVDDQTALLLKVHKSNYSIVGFSAEVSLRELVALGAEHGLPVMEDLGSGTFIDFSHYGLAKEPTVQESVAAGADVVTFSGDKLLGGPQAGLIVGRRASIERIKQNPLTRALRIDKLTLAALEGTLRLYRDPRRAVAAIPTLQMITMPFAVTQGRARQLSEALAALGDARLGISLRELASKAGGGALPLLDLRSLCVAVSIRGLSVSRVEAALRAGTPPVIARIEDDLLILDPRTLQEGETAIIVDAFATLLKRAPNDPK